MRSELVNTIASSVLILCSSVVDAEPMSFLRAGNGGNCVGCEWVAAQGEITSETPDEFRAYVEAYGKPYHIMLNSPGGSLIAGIELGRLIREQGSTTMIGATVPMTGSGVDHHETSEAGVCASACAFAFMGGVERYVGENDLLGVHQFYSSGDSTLRSDTVQALAGMTLFYTIQMGIDPRVIAVASGTASDDMFWFTQSELRELGLDTSSSVTDPWRLEPYLNGLVLTTTQHASKRRSVSVTLFCRQEDQGWRVLVSEEDPGYEDQMNGKKLMRMTGEYPNRPLISIGEDTFSVPASAIEFERFRDGRVLLSLMLPPQFENRGESSLTFSPDLARVFNDLLSFSVALPSGDWLQATKRNCI